MRLHKGVRIEGTHIGEPGGVLHRLVLPTVGRRRGAGGKLSSFESAFALS